MLDMIGLVGHVNPCYMQHLNHNEPEQPFSAPCFSLSVEEEDKHGAGENRRETENSNTFSDIDESLDLEKFSKRNDSDFSLSLARS